MLEKIVEINNIGCFRRYSAKGDVLFRKLTLVYAENGRGKTTLCAILRSLQSSQAEFIAERKTLATAEPAFVHVRLSGTSMQFSNDVWTSTYPDIVIFDSVFTNENVYSGDYVEHAHKKNAYRVIVGAQGVQLARVIENLDRQIRDINIDLRAKRELILRYLPTGVTLDDYLRWEPIADIEAQIQQNSVGLSKRQLHAEKSAEIQAKELFTEIRLPTMPSDFNTILAKQLTNIVADAEARVRQQITQHDMEHQGESWLSQGLGYVRNDRCPFCGQDVRLNDLIVAYRSQFNTAYRNLKQEVAQLSQRISISIGESSVSAIHGVLSNNLALAEFWKQFIVVELPELSFSDIQQKYTVLREHCIALAKRKQENPTEAITPSVAFSSVITDVEALRQIVDGYNVAISRLNNLVNEQKAASQREGDVTGLKTEIAQLEAKKRRFEPEVAQVCRDYQDTQETKRRLEERKDIVRHDLDEFCRDILMLCEQSINDNLDQFNTGFRITNTRHLYVGGTPSSHYQIEINSAAIDLGDSRTEPGTPCFKTTLSSGDRNALALAFFFAVLKQDPDISRKIIVFDDPFTSLDRFRRICTQQLIQRLSESVQQVIVFSHDPLFLKILYDASPSANNNVKTLQMAKTGNTTVINEWDIEAETQSTYMKDFTTLQDYNRDRKGDPRTVAKSIRPFLEGMLRNHFPGHFQDAEWLGDFIRKIREADSTSGLQHAEADLGELQAINDFSKKYHHNQGTNADLEPINEDELHGYVKRTLRLVGGN